MVTNFMVHTSQTEQRLEIIQRQLSKQGFQVKYAHYNERPKLEVFINPELFVYVAESSGNTGTEIYECTEHSFTLVKKFTNQLIGGPVNYINQLRGQLCSTSTQTVLPM